MTAGSGVSRRQTAGIRMVVAAAVLDAVAGCGLFRSAPPAPPPVVTPAPRLLDFEATAYSITGTTASGMQTRRGIVAADPKVLPIGSRIRVQDAGRYSGIYTVADTGSAINGHEIDIFIPSLAEAKRFGRRKVRVQILDKK